jgi:hypothetical protein
MRHVFSVERQDDVGARKQQADRFNAGTWEDRRRLPLIPTSGPLAYPGKPGKVDPRGSDFRACVPAPGRRVPRSLGADAVLHNLLQS